MEIELRHLRTVCGIADAGSITRAAIAVGTTQPALTATLQRIERALGGSLFHRTRDGVMPTAFGEFVLERARTVLAAADDLTHEVTRWHTDDSAHPVLLGGIPGSVLIRLADRLGASLPNATLSVSIEYSPRRLLELLAARRLDAAVIVDYPGHDTEPPPGVLVHLLATEPIFVAVPSNHPIATQPEVRLADLADEQWVLGPSDGAGWPEYFEATCLRIGFQPRVRHRIAELRPLQDILVSGRTISPCQATFSPPPGVTVRPLADDLLWMRYLVAWHALGAFRTCGSTLIDEATTAYRLDADRSPHYREWLAAHAQAG